MGSQWVARASATAKAGAELTSWSRTYFQRQPLAVFHCPPYRYSASQTSFQPGTLKTTTDKEQNL